MGTKSEATMTIHHVISFFRAEDTLLVKHLSQVAPTPREAASARVEWSTNLWILSGPKHSLIQSSTLTFTMLVL